jgi:hypothetical protein
MKIGDAFTMTVPPKYNIPHLFFVISDPCKNSGIYHIVNITTDYIRAGKECVLNVGDHKWITEPSYITFRDAREIDIALGKVLDSLVGTQIKMQAALRAEVLQRIVEAAKASKAIPIRFKKFL